MKIITADQLVCMNDYESTHPLRVELAYARADNFLFGEAIYKPNARLWLHEDLAKIVLAAAKLVYQMYGYRLVLYDGLRTVEAQARMLKTQRVCDNPHWLEPPRLLSPPGTGGHPRGMAVDVSLEDEGEMLIDMGTPFDFLAEDSGVAHNPAHRDYQRLSDVVKENRNILDNAIIGRGEELLKDGKVEMPIVGLPQEWWDFRAPADFYSAFAPLSDEDLPPEMRLCL